MIDETNNTFFKSFLNAADDLVFAQNLSVADIFNDALAEQGL